MNSSKISQIIALADEFEQQTTMTDPTDRRNDYNVKYQVQRDMLAKFYDFFHSRLRTVMGQMESNLGTLRARNFDKDMWNLLVRVYKHLENIYSHINHDKPYLAAQELVDYVNDRQRRAVIDNLDFLARHHLEQTKPETLAPLPPIAKHITEAESLGNLKELAAQIKEHMEKNPLIAEPITTPPPGRRENPAAQHPDQPVGPEALTKG